MSTRFGSHPGSGSLAQAEKSAATPWTPSGRLYLVFAALAVLTLVIALDGTVLSVALPEIANALDGDALKSFWAGTSFLLASTVLQPIFAMFSSVFGRMPAIMVALMLFLVGTFVCALSGVFDVLLAGRTLQGAGGGGMFTLSFSLSLSLVFVSVAKSP